MKPIDMDRLTPDILREERKLLAASRNMKIRRAAYERAIAAHEDAVQAQLRADDEVARLGEGDDDNWVFHTN